MGRAGIVKATETEEYTGHEKLIGFRAYEEDPFQDYYTDGELLHPPYDPAVLLQMKEYSTMLQQCVDAYKRNITGFGTSLKYTEDENQKEETTEMKAEWNYVLDWKKYFNMDKSFKDVWEQSIEHREYTGNAFIELLRDGANRVAGGDNVDPEYMRCSPLGERVKVTYETPTGPMVRMKRFRRYAQRMSSGSIVWFKEFGDPRYLDCNTGVFTNTHNGDNEATEILHLKIGDKAYGIPRWIGHLVHIYGARKAEELNFNYFKNGRHTPLAVVVSNGMLTQESYKTLQDYADGIKGVDNSHGFLLLEAEGLDEGEPGDEEKAGVKVELKPIAEILQQDGLFLEYDQKSSEKLQSAFRLPDLYVGKNKDFNRATADTAKQVAEEQVFIPERTSLEFVVNNQLLGTHQLQFVQVEFDGPIISDTEDKVKMLTVLKELNALAPNDVRELAGETINKELENFDLEEANLPVALANMIKAAETAKQQSNQKPGTPVQKSMETENFINLLKEIRDELDDYNTVIEKIKSYGETA